jgi:hypothetical protein
MCEGKNKPQIGQKPTNEDDFYLDWGKESLKNNIKLSNDVLKQLITLSTALLGLSIIYEKIVENEILRVIVMILFFLSLLLSLLGILPYEKKILLNSASQIKQHKVKALKHKRFYLWFSAAGITFGFAIILAELIIKLF